MGIVFGTLLALSSIFLILLVLVQQGKGGGLAGAFGGMGGQSAFGTKAGDVFTRITIVTALVWIIVCLLTIRFMSTPTNLTKDYTPATSNTPATGAPKDGVTPPATPENKAGDKTPPAPPAPEVPAVPAVPQPEAPMAPMSGATPALPESTTPPAETPPAK